MTIRRLACSVIVLLIVIFTTAGFLRAGAQTSSLTINVGRELVQFILKDKPQQMRIEVYSVGGELFFDSGEVSDNTVIWNLQNLSGEPVADGVYMARLSITADSGKVVKRTEQVIIARSQQTEHQPNVTPAAEGNKVDGSGTPGRISKWTAITTIGDSVIDESNNRIGIGISPTGVLHVDEAQPASAVSNGTPAAPLLQLSGGKGGDTTGLAVSAGAGADVSLFAGNGGSAPVGSTNGKGGNILLQPGSPGAGGGATGELGKLLLAPLGGNVGIGTLSPGSKLTVFGRIEADNPGNGTGVLGQSDTGSGLRGVSTSGSAVLGTSDTGIGVRGISNRDAGVRGSSTSGIGVVGISSSGLAGGFIGNVGITGSLGVGGASTADGSTLAVAGNIHLTGGGFKFPDGSLQTTAGIATVVHDITMAGNGTQGSPLTVANMGIGNAQLANGAVSSAKIFVPLALSGSDTGAILSVTNLGGGAAIQAAGAISTTTGYNIGGNRVLSIGGMGNLFVGPDAGFSTTTGGFSSFFGTGAGQNNTTGSANSFFGVDAGWGNTSGNENSFFGKFAGVHNTIGSYNSFFGKEAGYNNTTGNLNSFFGLDAGHSNIGGDANSFFGANAGSDNTTGDLNSFFGRGAGTYNTTGGSNSFFGVTAGHTNTTGVYNSFFGVDAGFNNTTGNDNSFFGKLSGLNNTTEDNNTFIGAYSNGHAGITNATAVGYRAEVTQSNSLVLGSINGVNSASADTNVGIGTTAPQKKLHVVGDVRIDGNLSKASGSFKIDHPLDPENKYLYHSFVESPDMMNIYNGNITTGKSGEAIVTLPDYFSALNRDFRYQLTVIGTFSQAIVAEEIMGNRFTIKTSAPNVKVSWQVTGIRQDAYANKHRIPVEEEKSQQERGHYLHPDVFNQTKERGIELAHHTEIMQRMKETRDPIKQKQPGEDR
jgi:hypothetical protein